MPIAICARLAAASGSASPSVARISDWMAATMGFCPEQQLWGGVSSVRADRRQSHAKRALLHTLDPEPPAAHLGAYDISAPPPPNADRRDATGASAASTKGGHQCRSFRQIRFYRPVPAPLERCAREDQVRIGTHRERTRQSGARTGPADPRSPADRADGRVQRRRRRELARAFGIPLVRRMRERRAGLTAPRNS